MRSYQDKFKSVQARLWQASVRSDQVKSGHFKVWSCEDVSGHACSR